jgi:hypothetical protein
LAERPPLNRKVVGSYPTWEAKLSKKQIRNGLLFYFIKQI